MDNERMRLQAGLASKANRRTCSRQLRDLVRQPEFLLIWLIPFAVFLFLSLFYAYGFLQLSELCVLASAFFGLLAAVLVSAKNRNHLYLPLGFAMGTAVLLGSTCGLYIYDRYTVYPMFYANSRTYNNVVPSQPSGAVADAGKIVFTSESSVDVEHSVSYVTENGDTYCVAPVRDKSGAARIEFWAAGVDCCESVGDFSCDKAKNPDAHAGIIIFENNGFFGNSRRDYYEKARQKAEAQFGLLSAAEPAYVRWVTATDRDLDYLANHYRTKGIVSLLVFSFMYSIAAAFLAFFVYQPKLFGEAFSLA